VLFFLKKNILVKCLLEPRPTDPRDSRLLWELWLTSLPICVVKGLGVDAAEVQYESSKAPLGAPRGEFTPVRVLQRLCFPTRVLDILVTKLHLKESAPDAE